MARRTTIPIATGERLTTKFDFARLLEHRAAAIFNFDVGQVGGLLEAKKSRAWRGALRPGRPARLRRAADAAAALHLSCAAPTSSSWRRSSASTGPRAVRRRPFEWHDGYLLPPRAPARLQPARGRGQAHAPRGPQPARSVHTEQGQLINAAERVRAPPIPSPPQAVVLYHDAGAIYGIGDMCRRVTQPPETTAWTCRNRTTRRRTTAGSSRVSASISRIRPGSTIDAGRERPFCRRPGNGPGRAEAHARDARLLAREPGLPRPGGPFPARLRHPPVP